MTDQIEITPRASRQRYVRVGWEADLPPRVLIPAIDAIAGVWVIPGVSRDAIREWWKQPGVRAARKSLKARGMSFWVHRWPVDGSWAIFGRVRGSAILRAGDWRGPWVELDRQIRTVSWRVEKARVVSIDVAVDVLEWPRPGDSSLFHRLVRAKANGNLWTPAMCEHDKDTWALLKRTDRASATVYDKRVEFRRWPDGNERLALYMGRIGEPFDPDPSALPTITRVEYRVRRDALRRAGIVHPSDLDDPASRSRLARYLTRLVRVVDGPACGHRALPDDSDTRLLSMALRRWALARTRNMSALPPACAHRALSAHGCALPSGRERTQEEKTGEHGAGQRAVLPVWPARYGNPSWGGPFAHE